MFSQDVIKLICGCGKFGVGRSNAEDMGGHGGIVEGGERRGDGSRPLPNRSQEDRFTDAGILIPFHPAHDDCRAPFTRPPPSSPRFQVLLQPAPQSTLHLPPHHLLCFPSPVHPPHHPPSHLFPRTLDNPDGSFIVCTKRVPFRTYSSSLPKIENGRENGRDGGANCALGVACPRIGTVNQ